MWCVAHLPSGETLIVPVHGVTKAYRDSPKAAVFTVILDPASGTTATLELDKVESLLFVSEEQACSIANSLVAVEIEKRARLPQEGTSTCGRLVQVTRELPDGRVEWLVDVEDYFEDPDTLRDYLHVAAGPDEYEVKGQEIWATPRALEQARQALEAELREAGDL